MRTTRLSAWLNNDAVVGRWLNGSVTQRKKTVCDHESSSTRENVVLDKDEDLEPCTIVIPNSSDDESDKIEAEDGEEDDNCPEMNSTRSEVLAHGSRNSPHAIYK